MFKKKYQLCISALFIILIFSTSVIITTSNDMLGISRVINYAGIVRGATQRLVKLEISNNPNDELKDYISDIINQLQTDEQGSHNLIKIHDDDFQQSLSELELIWEDLILEIDKTRLVGYEQTDIINISEKHFKLADDSVSFAESFSDSLLKIYSIAKNVMILSTISLVATLILLWKKLRLSNKELERVELISHIDLPTGLPNKSKCEQKFAQYGILSESVQYGLIMFDLNNLKKINDKLGHNAGDLLILNFATILKQEMDDNAFVSRFGGDEFIAIYDNTTEDQIQSYINRIKDATIEFSSKNCEFEILYAVGYALSEFKENVNLYTLLEKADNNMYIDKRRCKDCLEPDM